MSRALLSLIVALAPALAPWLKGLGGAARRRAAWILIGVGALALLARQVAAGGTLLLLGVTLLAPGAVLGTDRARRPSPGGASTVRTDVLEMRLDHDSGAMDGTVLAGPFRGRRLSGMTRDELLRLSAAVDPADDRTLRLLRAHLDRAHPGWRDEGAPPPPAGAPMGRAEALGVLGLPPDADDDAVRAAHRRLVKRVHPDAGGSAALAAQINAAKDALLGPRG
jgi:hypothetical protein